MELTPNRQIPIPDADPENRAWQLKAMAKRIDEIWGEMAALTFSAASYDDLTVTVPAPTVAPTLVASDAENNAAGSFTASTTYRVAYTYVVFDGTQNGDETGLSPHTSFTAAALQGITVLPKAKTDDNSKYIQGCFIYLSDDGGSTWHRADWTFGTNAFISPGEETWWGGQPVKWNPSGAAPPVGAATATTWGGRTVEPPAEAPTVSTICLLPAATYHGAYCWTAGDGTDGGLSPISSGVAMVDRKYFLMSIPQEPPSGAVKLKVYLGTSNSAGAMHLQATLPLNHVRPTIQTYNAGGAAPSAGSAQSVVSGFQQAYDAAKDAGGGVVVVQENCETQVPIILRLKNASGSSTVRVRVEGANYDGLGNSNIQIEYTGTQTDVVGVLVADSLVIWRNLNFHDPNNRVKYAHATCDFFGGGGFNSKWENSMFSAGADGGIGLSAPLQGANSGAHGISNQFYENCFFIGRCWGVDLHQAQMGSMKFLNCGGQAYNNTGGTAYTANSGYWRLAGGFNLDIDGADDSGPGTMHTVLLTGDFKHPQANSNSAITIKNHHTESQSGGNGGFSFVHCTQSAGLVRVGLIANSFSQANDPDFMSFFSATAGVLTVIDNDRGNGNGWFFQSNTTLFQYDKMLIAVVGRDNFFSLEADNFFNPSPYRFVAKGISTSVLDYTHPVFKAFIGAYALINETGEVSTVETNPTGDLVLRSNSGAIKAVADNAYDATGWNGSLRLVTENAIRDKIEALITAIAAGYENPTFTGTTFIHDVNHWFDVGGNLFGGSDAFLIAADGTREIVFRINGAGRFGFSSAGHFLAVAHNTYDIGNTTQAPRDLFLGRDAIISGKVGVGMTPSEKLDVAGTIRAGGQTTPPATGVGIEISHDGSVGYIQSYNRATSDTPLYISGSYIRLNEDGQGPIGIGPARTPSSASDTGHRGDIAWDSSYIYLCVATNTWKRVAIASW